MLEENGFGEGYTSLVELEPSPLPPWRPCSAESHSIAFERYPGGKGPLSPIEVLHDQWAMSWEGRIDSVSSHSATSGGSTLGADKWLVCRRRCDHGSTDSSEAAGGGVSTPHSYSATELDLLAMHMTLVKILFLRGVLTPLPYLFNALGT